VTRRNPDRGSPPHPGGAAAADEIRDLVVDAVAERINAKINKKIAREQARPGPNSALKVEALQRVAEQVRALDVWTRPGPRTRQPRHSREEIAAVAIEIADAEGFAAVSMRRLASELGAGTMTLYHYVRTKDELLTLLTDAVMGEVVVPDDSPFPANWRDALKLIAHRTRKALARHPWIFDITDDPPIGPNSVRHFDQTLAAVASLDLPLVEKFDIVAAVDEYVFGYSMQERTHLQPEAGPHDAEMIRYVKSLLTTGEYPQLEAIAQEHGLETAWAKIAENLRDPKRFERNLDRLLDGIEAGFPGA
jgi:AcrR family transcriptional regulator